LVDDRPAVSRLYLALLALAALPFLVSAVAVLLAVGSDYHAWGDVAAIELLTRDVPDHPPLLGLFSQGDWNHPGPALF
jgi:hypothetical protein